MLRKALASARRAGVGPSQVKAQLTAKARAPPFRAQVQHYVRQVLHETFPTLSSSISTSSRQATRGYTYALQPIRLGTRTFRPQSPHARLHTAAQAFRSSYALPHAARAGRMAGNVGIGNARGFASGASGPVHSQMLNVPVAFRAFAALLSDEQHEKALPRPSRVHPYLPERHRRKRQCRRASRYSYTSIDSHLSDLSAYFPHIQKLSEVQVALPVVTEELITPGKTSVLSLPLSPSLSSLLDPTPIPYAEAEVGVAVLSTLTSGLLSLQEAFGIHFADRILPLLAHIDGTGLLAIAGTGRVTYEVVLDVQGQPDILKLTFHDRSLQNVRDILADRLVGAGWWSLREIQQVTELSRKERVEMMEDWTQQVSAATVIMPILNLAHHHEVENDDQAVDVLFEYPDSSASGFSSPLSAMDQASVSSGFASPISDLDRDYSDADDGYATSRSNVSFISESNASPDHSTSGSIFSSIAPLHSSHDFSWLSPPSEADTDVESAISAELIQELNEVWDVEVDCVETGGEAEGYLWTGGNGFGLMQPW